MNVRSYLKIIPDIPLRACFAANGTFDETGLVDTRSSLIHQTIQTLKMLDKLSQIYDAIKQKEYSKKHPLLLHGC